MRGPSASRAGSEPEQVVRFVMAVPPDCAAGGALPRDDGVPCLAMAALGVYDVAEMPHGLGGWAPQVATVQADERGAVWANDDACDADGAAAGRARCVRVDPGRRTGAGRVPVPEADRRCLDEHQLPGAVAVDGREHRGGPSGHGNTRLAAHPRSFSSLPARM